jgi:transposase InsO family protein
MKKKRRENHASRLVRWAQFRFSVVGGLLSSPPERGQLRHEVRLLSQKTWRHPMTQQDYRIGSSTIERWYYQTQRQDRNPIDDLQPKRRKDIGRFKKVDQRAVSGLKKLYEEHPTYRYQLLYDNLQSWALQQQPIVDIPSYTTIRRLCKANGWLRKKNPIRQDDGTPLPSSLIALAHVEQVEIRSYEHEFVGGLWHLDFHKGSKKVLSHTGSYVVPLCLCIIDDASRLVCHAQWYLSEETESLVHGVIQAFQKRGLPRSIMSDNGSAMISAEFTDGLSRLSITHSLTLAYSPYQNGKQERFWGTLEGRLIQMLQDVRGLTLNQLNDVTQMWMEADYHQCIHSEINQTPSDRFLRHKNVLRNTPSADYLEQAFTREEKRTQRQKDGTVSIAGIRYEIPSAYRHHIKVSIRMASWDKSHAYLCHPLDGRILVKILPLDKIKNAEGHRRRHAQADYGGSQKERIDIESLPPLLQEIVREHQLSGLPPSYIRQTIEEKESTKTDQPSNNIETSKKENKNESK